MTLYMEVTPCNVTLQCKESKLFQLEFVMFHCEMCWVLTQCGYITQPAGTCFMVLPWILNFEPSFKEKREGGNSVAWLSAWIWIIILKWQPAGYWGYRTNLSFQWI